MIAIQLQSYTLLCLIAGFSTGVLFTIVARRVIQAVDPKLLHPPTQADYHSGVA